MPPKAESRLMLLVDQTQISIEERNRLLLLNLQPSTSEDEEIVKSLRTLLEGINRLEEDLESTSTSSPDKELDANIQNLRKSYARLIEVYQEDPSVDVTGLNLEPRVPKVEHKVQRSKSVRFRENLIDEEPQTSSKILGSRSQQSVSRTALSSSGALEQVDRFIQPYKDDPEPQNLSTNQVLLQQQDLLQDQDGHLDRLASSVSRQHQLSIEIGDELESHVGLLGDLEGLTDSGHHRLETAKQRLTKFSNKAKQNGSLLTIAILIIIFIILIIVLK